MLGPLIILFTVVPAVELIVLLEVGKVIGSFNTILTIIVTGVLGASLARMQGIIVLQSIQNELNKGQMPSDQLLDGLMILIGGIVLLTPGFVTDAIGFFLLIPWTRALLKHSLRHKFEEMIRKGQVVNMTSFPSGAGRYNDIDVK